MKGAIAVYSRQLFSTKKIYYPEQTKNIVAKTAGIVEKVAAITLGPYGRNILIQS